MLFRIIVRILYVAFVERQCYRFSIQALVLGFTTVVLMLIFIQAASVAALQESDLPDGVIYQNRDGQMEVVTLRESTTGTLYVWPVFMN